MKTLLITLFFTIGILSTNAQTKGKNTETTTFYIENMTCNNCIKKIEKNIPYEKGVTDLKCDLQSKTVSVTYRTDKTDKEKLVLAFDKIKKKASVLDNTDKASKK